MRGLLLWCMLALAVVAGAETVLEEEVVEVDLLENEDARIDVARALSDLFTFDDLDDEEHDLEEGINREARTMAEETSEVESKAVVAPEDQARYNKFMDTFYRRLNADARSSIDPLDVPLIARKNRGKKDSGKKGNKGGGAKKTGGNKDEKKNKKKNKKNQKKGNKKAANNKKNKKTGRHPKSLGLEEVEDESDNEEVAVAEEEEEVHHIVARDAPEEETDGIEEVDTDLEGRSSDADAGVAEEEVAAASRRVPLKTEKKKKNKGKGKNNKRNNRKNKNKNKSKAKRSTNKNNKKKGKSTKGKKSARKGPQTSRASVSGIATLTRVGDVSVVNRKDGKELRSDFKIGPVKLKVNRKFGKGKDADLRTATASSPELTGRMHLYVAADGKAKITKFNIIKPSVVTTDGSLSKDQNKPRADNNFMENSIGRVTPVAAKKLKLAARAVLQATESKN